MRFTFGTGRDPCTSSAVDTFAHLRNSCDVVEISMSSLRMLDMRTMTIRLGN